MWYARLYGYDVQVSPLRLTSFVVIGEESSKRDCFQEKTVWNQLNRDTAPTRRSGLRHTPLLVPGLYQAAGSLGLGLSGAADTIEWRHFLRNLLLDMGDLLGRSQSSGLEVHS